MTRRRMLGGMGALSVAALVGPEVLAACSAGSPGPLDGHQTDVVREATARLIPGPLDEASEAGHPGAREADVTAYITTMLSALTFEPPKVFAGGPFSNRSGSGIDDMAHFLALDTGRVEAWRLRLGAIVVAYQHGVAALDAAAPGAGFLALDAAAKDRVLATNPRVPSLPSEFTGFTDMLFAHAIEGMYSVPEYGGNAGRAGWRDIGFPGDVQPRGYPAAEVSSPLSRTSYQPTAAVGAVLGLIGATAPKPVGPP